MNRGEKRSGRRTEKTKGKIKNNALIRELIEIGKLTLLYIFFIVSHEEGKIMNVISLNFCVLKKIKSLCERVRVLFTFALFKTLATSYFSTKQC